VGIINVTPKPPHLGSPPGFHSIVYPVSVVEGFMYYSDLDGFEMG
jgi:hypothetical protein